MCVVLYLGVLAMCLGVLPNGSIDRNHNSNHKKNCIVILRAIGQREFVNMLPLVCNDAFAILFMFDLSRKSTLNSIKEWYRQARGFNKVGGAL